ncbi:hypothetical protein, partial [Roseateles sp. P5_E11]
AKTGLPTPTDHEQLFESVTAGGEQRTYHLHKWSSYFSGRHVPRSVLPVVEASFPGASACLTNPLWSALTAASLTRRELESLIAGLDPDIQLLVKRRGSQPSRLRSGEVVIDGVLAAALERRAGLDALTAAVIMLRMANVSQQPAVAYEWSRSVLRMLVVLGELFTQRGIARPLFELVEERLLPMAVHDGAMLGFFAFSYLDVADRYAQMVRYIRGLENIRTAALPRLRQRILDGHHGFDCLFAFNPFRAVSLCRDHAGSIANPHCRPHLWSWNMLSAGGHRGMPPEDVWSGRNLWARAEGSAA